MAFSEYLNSKKADCRELVGLLSGRFPYVSILGTEVRSSVYNADRKNAGAKEGTGESGFVVKINDGRAFVEYSTDTLGDPRETAEKITAYYEKASKHADSMVSVRVPDDPAAQGDFVRDNDFEEFDDEVLLGTCRELSAEVCSKDEKILNAVAAIQYFTVSKLFVSPNRTLTQNYGWANGNLIAVYSDGKTAQARCSEGERYLRDIISDLRGDVDKVVDLARHLAHATPIKPGYYDVITDNSITGLIAHEAFGHGVEMDQFVKDRALGKYFVGKRVASPITNMRDGAASAVSVASYFFDDDGVMAHDTQIIKDGILVAGLSDLTSAAQLGTEPTGNGRRESFKRKAYSRMTNTFFEAGKDKLEDMIASVKHGYMLFETNNGMEDPKNWAIQCTAEYGIEIVDGKLTENYVSPVVMSGYVPDLLNSISMISDNFKVIGCGGCGKGYKEWVRVSDGGPNLKVKVKLG